MHPYAWTDPRLLYAFPAVLFVVHIAEEWPKFPAWATRHFGTTTPAFFIYSHIPLVIADVLVSCLAMTRPLGSVWALLATAAQWVLVTNGLFHLATTVLFREYSPGVVTGTALFLPAGAYVIQQTALKHLLTTEQLSVAMGLGTIAGMLVIASLWLDMDFDWRLRHRRAR